MRDFLQTSTQSSFAEVRLSARQGLGLASGGLPHLLGVVARGSALGVAREAAEQRQDLVELAVRAALDAGHDGVDDVRGAAIVALAPGVRVAVADHVDRGGEGRKRLLRQARLLQQRAKIGRAPGGDQRGDPLLRHLCEHRERRLEEERLARRDGADQESRRQRLALDQLRDERRKIVGRRLEGGGDGGAFARVLGDRGRPLRRRPAVADDEFAERLGELAEQDLAAPRAAGRGARAAPGGARGIRRAARRCGRARNAARARRDCR